VFEAWRRWFVVGRDLQASIFASIEKKKERIFYDKGKNEEPIQYLLPPLTIEM